jgi:hypothetical protein
MDTDSLSRELSNKLLFHISQVKKTIVLSIILLKEQHFFHCGVKILVVPREQQLLFELAIKL